MGEYCSNHVIEAIADYASKAKEGRVTVEKPGSGTCVAGHCGTPSRDIHRLSYEPAEVTSAAEPQTEAPPTESTPTQEAEVPA